MEDGIWNLEGGMWHMGAHTPLRLLLPPNSYTVVITAKLASLRTV